MFKWKLSTQPMVEVGLAYLGAGFVVSFAIGYLGGRFQESSRLKAKVGQKIQTNEMERWKLDQQYVTLLMQKDPPTAAAKELEVLEKRMAHTKSELSKLGEEVDEELKTFEKLRTEFQKQSNKASKLLFAETRLSPWFANTVTLRTRTESLNNVIVSYEMQRRFLELVKAGRTKPGLIKDMDNVATQWETERPKRQNYDLMKAVQKGMDGITDEMLDMMGLSSD